MLWNLNFLLIVIDLPAFLLIPACIPLQMDHFKITVSFVLCDCPLDNIASETCSVTAPSHLFLLSWPDYYFSVMLCPLSLFVGGSFENRRVFWRGVQRHPEMRGGPVETVGPSAGQRGGRGKPKAQMGPCVENPQREAGEHLEGMAAL